MPRPVRPSRLPLASALVLAALVGTAAPARAQSPLDSLRADMETTILRLAQVDQGMLRATMQAPDFEQHVGYLQVMIASVQLDLDYIEALIQMVGLARDPAAASAIVRREMEGAQQRLMLDQLEEDIRVRRESGDYTPPLLQMIERDLVGELRRVIGMYERAQALLPPPAG